MSFLGITHAHTHTPGPSITLITAGHTSQWLWHSVSSRNYTAASFPWSEHRGVNLGIVDVVDPVMKFILVRKFLPAAVRQMREGVWALLVSKTSLGAPGTHLAPAHPSFSCPCQSQDSTMGRFP